MKPQKFEHVNFWKFLPRAFCALVLLDLTSDDGTIALFQIGRRQPTLSHGTSCINTDSDSCPPEMKPRPMKTIFTIQMLSTLFQMVNFSVTVHYINHMTISQSIVKLH